MSASAKTASDQPAVAGTDKPEGAAPSSALADVFAAAFGLVTSLLTGLLLWFIAVKFHFAIHKLTLWFVIPFGAFFSGWAAASGYYFAYQLYRRRPGRLLLPNVIAAALGTFLLIHYMSYLSFKAAVGRIGDSLSFLQFLDIAIRSTSIRIMSVTSTSSLGTLGYVTTFLEVVGFAFGAFALYHYLRSQEYCDRCLWRLALKGKQVRYAPRPEDLLAKAAEVAGLMKQGDAAGALERHTGFGSFARYPGSSVRSICSVYSCRHCGRHTAVFALQRPSGEDWGSVPPSVVYARTDSPISISR
jgi:hypothetical protein